ncbi:MAG: xanthine dehydrogenase family protein molybdopterin-binding subunit [Deltaproteobacteria bacterium]|nr:MAG: xanthine dehydrogenase family protein molybdopterin-binding subunit [Deltaproteobacteria bacterium]
MLRREFVGGLLVAVAGRTLAAQSPKKPKTSDEALKERSEGLRPNVFIHVASDGKVTLVNHRSEMGQGVRSTIPALLADELGADPGRVEIEQADGDKKYGDQNTDGSNSIRGEYEDLRRAAATAREMLIAAAAQRWRVPAGSLTARDHAVWNGSRSLGFGELADAAGRLPVPKPESVKLRPRSEMKHVFRDLPLVDARAIATGAAKFGADVPLEGMLIAVIARPPVVGGKVVRLDDSKALAVPGVKQVIRMPEPKPPYKFQPWGGVAVLATNTWAALRGREALRIEWDHGPNAVYDSDRFASELSRAVHQPGHTARNVGDVDTALAKAAKTIEAEYHVPHLAHVPMEPPAAIARFEDGKCELWAATQNPQDARTQAAETLGIDESRVTSHVTLLGGAFGRKSKADFVAEAAYLAREAKAPVRVQWTREDDLRHDYYNAVNTQLLTAALDAEGKVTAWRQRTAFPPIATTFSDVKGPSAGDLQQGVTDLPLAIPNVRAETCDASAHVRIGWLRSVYNIFHGFSAGSFMDELAYAHGKDPRDNLLELFGPPRLVTLQELGVDKLRNYGASLDKHPIDTGRLRRVIERVASMARWSDRSGRALGLAAHRSFLTYVAVVVSVKKNALGKIAVDEAWLAADAGTVVNLERARAQMEGALIFGMSHAFYGGATMKAGVTEQSNFDTYRLVRMPEAPRALHVELVESDGPPGGIGEPGVPPVAPAIANAIFVLTGQRIRTLPLMLAGVV